jgi:hypothetical protein
VTAEGVAGRGGRGWLGGRSMIGEASYVYTIFGHYKSFEPKAHPMIVKDLV